MNDQRPTSFPPLEYASPSDDQLSSGRMLFQAVLACGLTCGLLMGSVFVLTFMAFIGSAGNSAIGVVIAIAVAGLILAGAIRLAIRTRRDPMHRGWAMGIWIGIGLACLLEGLCFGGELFR